MDAKEAKVLIDTIFSLISNATTIHDLQNILEHPALLKSRMDNSKYPKIEFSISDKEIESMIDSGILNSDLTFSNTISSQLKDPITKLLYAMIWKNGDLKKEKHICQGILDSNKVEVNRKSTFVFYQFGKYLTKTKGQPIIDQHVLRAFAIFVEIEGENVNEEKVDEIRRTTILKVGDVDLIKKYKTWLLSVSLNDENKNFLDYTYYIDKILFATGKTIKAAPLQPIN